MRLPRETAWRSADLLLRESEERFRAVAETATDAIILAEEEGRITYFNNAAETMFGYSSAEVIGELLTKLMPSRFHELHLKGMSRYLTTKESHVIGTTVELVGRRKDGSEFPLELSLATWTLGPKTQFAGIVRDLTERRRAEENRLKLREVELRHDQALQLNDNIVQGLCVAKMALELGMEERLSQALDQTLSQARSIVTNLIKVRGGAGRPLDLKNDAPDMV